MVSMTDSLDETECIALNFIRLNPSATRAQIAVEIGKSEATAKRVLASLVKKGIIKRTGSKKSGSWKVLIGDSE